MTTDRERQTAKRYVKYVLVKYQDVLRWIPEGLLDNLVCPGSWARGTALK